MKLGANMMSGLGGMKVRNTFLEFQEQALDDALNSGWGRQLSEPVKSCFDRQISDLTTAGSVDNSDHTPARQLTMESCVDPEDPLLLGAFPAGGMSQEKALQATLQAVETLESAIRGNSIPDEDLSAALTLASSWADPCLTMPSLSMPAPPMQSRAAAPQQRTAIHFCPACGSKVQPTHRFCPYCCYQLTHLQQQSVSEERVRVSSVAATAPKPRPMVQTPGQLRPTEKGNFLNLLGLLQYQEVGPQDVQLAQSQCLAYLNRV
eukprot:TRINITY_DN66430_c0_g1_i1.p1 TRINITY_DN66430_c0_g1~~TRINITY_DN66430_c0_g1_i1.p1  ORF type:complete len:263 (+),score=44.14 TRINITY_DN66430_c0_g1_i1:72-860(+)